MTKYIPGLIALTETINPSSVALLRGSDAYETTSRVLRLLRDDLDINTDERVLIKPNCVRPVAPNKGVTTDAGVVEAIIEYLFDKGIHDLVIAEGGNPGIEKAFTITGMRDLEKKYNVELVNLNKDEWKEISIPGASALKKVKISKTVLETDKIINVPKLKIHHMAQVTLSLKNFMGVIVDNRGLVMHDRLDEKIVDLASLFRPVLNVIDGVVGSEMDEVVGEPVESNVIIAGVDMVSVDSVGSAVMGLDPSSIRHIQLAAERGLGVADLNQVNLIGDPISVVMMKFSTDFSDRKLQSYGLDRPLTEEDLVYMKNSFANRDPKVTDPYKKHST